MTERILAPGVYSSETDQSFIAPIEIQSGLAVVGPTEKGQAFVPTDINSFSQYNAIFGLDSANSYVPQTVFNYLQAGDNVKVTRVLGNGGWSYSNTKKLAAIVSGSKILTVLHPSQNAQPTLTSLNGSTVSTTGSYNLFNLTLSGSQVYKQVSASLDPTATNYITKVLGTDAKFQTGSAFPYLNFPNYFTGSVSGSAQVSMSLSSTAITFTSSYAEGYDAASTPWVVSAAGDRLFKFVHKSHGFKTNKDVKVCIGNITVNADPTVYTKFDVIVRAWNDTEKTPSILEQYLGVTLDPNSSNYISLAIGDKYQEYDVATGKVIEDGDYPSISNFIRVDVNEAIVNDSINPNIAPNGHEALFEPIAGFPGFTLPSASFTFSSTASAVYSGFNYYNSDNINYLNPIPLEASVGVNVAFTKPVNDNKFVVPFQGGTDGMSYSVIKKIGADIESDGSNVFGFDLSTAVSSGTSAFRKALDILSNKQTYGFDILAIPGVLEQYHNSVTSYAESMVESRADAVYLRDLTSINATVATAVATAEGLDSSYSAAYYPWIKVKDIAGGNDKYVPPTVMVPQAVAYNDKVAAPWKAVAGTGRGQLGGAIDVKNRLTQTELGLLTAANINGIIKKTGTGVVIWGIRTLQATTTALSQLPVRRLLIELKKYIESVSDDLVFEPNTETTKIKFKNIVNPYLKSIQQREGLIAYRVVMDDTNNSNADIDRGILRGQIQIQPTRAIEYILLDFQIQATGVTFE